MSDIALNVGQRLPLKKRSARVLASLALLGTVTLGAWAVGIAPTIAGGETRTISMVFPHTGEKLTVTYMKDGRYVPSAMAKINHLLRDWRRNEVTTIDPRTIDLVWELHADLGSKLPIHIVSGYRSPRTNAFLKRIGRKVAKKSQHMKGKAIDFYFPDVSTATIRNSALARRVGGVGYYRSAGGPTGFIHADSGNVRHWGPGMSPSQMAGLIREGRKAIGKRMGRKGYEQQQMIMADAGGAPTKKSGSIWSLIAGDKTPEPETNTMPLEDVAAAPAPVESAYEGNDDELADMSADAAAAEAAAEAATAAKARTKAVVKVPDAVADGKAEGELAALSQTASLEGDKAEIKTGYPVPRPRLKPRAVAQLAEARLKEIGADVQIQPASAPPEMGTIVQKPSAVGKPLKRISNDTQDVAESDPLDDAISAAANPEGKTNLNSEGEDMTTAPLFASMSGTGGVTTIKWSKEFKNNVLSNMTANGEKVSLRGNIEDILPKAVTLGPDGTGPVTSPAQLIVADGKSDSQIVNRRGKSGLPAMKLRLTSKTSSN